MKFTILSILLLIKVELSAQNFSIVNGDTIDLCSDFLYSEIISQDTTGFYILEQNYGKCCGYLMKISSKDAKLIYRIHLPVLEPAKHPVLIEKEVVNDKILLFYTVEDEKNEKSLLLFELDAKTGKALGDFKLVDKISHDYTSLAHSGALDYYVVFSPDKSKVAIFSEIKKIKDDSREIKEFHATVKLFSTKQYTKLWEKPLISSHGNSIVLIRDYVLTNDGLFYYLFDFLTDQKHYNKRQGISMTGENSKKDKVYELDNKTDTRTLLGKKVRLSLTANKLFCTGFFVDGEQTEFLSSKTGCGFFLFVIDPKTFSVQKQDFSYTKDHIEITNPDMLTNLTTGSILEDEKGGYYCIKIEPWDSNWNYGRIGVCKYNKDFDLEWMKIIPRYAYTAQYEAFRQEPLLGFNFLQYDGGLRFFYPEHKKNLIKFPDMMKVEFEKYVDLKSPKDAVLVCTTVTSKGELSRQLLPINNQSVFFGEVGEEEKLWIKKTNTILVKNYISVNKKSYSLFTYSKP